MGDTHHPHQTVSSRLGLRNAGGDIVEVHGGHIVRSTGRKDRHSKVCTAKGPRDRRVRLSAHTAIQFYDVQDRLGYDRPSKAVDWLIKKAKAAIDDLAQLPAWNPTTGSTANASFDQEQTVQAAQKQRKEENQDQLFLIHHNSVMDTVAGSSSTRRAIETTLLDRDGSARCGIQNQQQQLQISSNHNENSSSFLPPSLDSDAIADTIKSFFPMGASAQSNSSAMQFQNFPPPDLLSRMSSQSQDLRLSLQSFQDPILIQHHHNQASQHQNHQNEQALFSGTTTQLGFDGSGWSEHQSGEIGRFQRMVAWNTGGDAENSGGGGGFIFNSPPTSPLLQPLFGQNQLFSQRGPLQSSNTPLARAWIDPFSIAATTTTTAHQHHHHQTLQVHPSSMSGIGFAHGGGFSGFRIPARIQGEEEEHDGISNQPSSASSDSRH